MLDEAALADDVVMREFYDLDRRAELHGRPDAPFWEFREFLGVLRSPDSGERTELFAAYDGDRMVGNADPVVLPARQRRQGEVQAEGRRTRSASGRRPGAGPAPRAGRQGRRSVADHDRHQSCPSTTGTATPTGGSSRPAATCSPSTRWSDTSLYRWPTSGSRSGSTRPRRTTRGTRSRRSSGAVPDDLVESLCLLLGQLAVDAPTGAVDFEEETFTPQRYDEWMAATAAMGRVCYETVALTPRPAGGGPVDARRVAGRQHGRLPVGHLRAPRAPRPPARTGREGGQPPRGPGRPQRPDPGHTQNGDINDYMVAINERMGFRPIEVSAEFVKHL